MVRAGYVDRVFEGKFRDGLRVTALGQRAVLLPLGPIERNLDRLEDCARGNVIALDARHARVTSARRTNPGRARLGRDRLCCRKCRYRRIESRLLDGL